MMRNKILVSYTALWSILSISWVVSAFYLAANSPEQQKVYSLIWLTVWAICLLFALFFLNRRTKIIDRCLGSIERKEDVSDQELRTASKTSFNLPIYGWILFTIFLVVMSLLQFILLKIYGPFGNFALIAIWIGGIAGTIACPQMALGVFGVFSKSSSGLFSLELERRGLKTGAKRLNLATKWSVCFIGIAIGYGVWVGGLGYYTSILQVIEEGKNKEIAIQRVIIDNLKLKIDQEFTLENLKPIIDEIKIGKEGFAFLADKQGNIVYNPKKEEVFVKRWADINDNLVKGIKSGQPGSLYENVNERIISYSPINKEYVLGTASYLSERLPRLNIYFLWLVIFMLGAIIVVVIDVGTLASWTTRSVVNVSSVLKKITAGDFTKRIATESRDEVGDLASDCNTMAIALQSYKDKLEQSKAETENIIQSQTDLVFVVDTKGIILKANRAVFDTLGYKKDEVIGKSAGLMFYPDTRERDIEVGPKKAISGEIVVNAELTLMTKDGKRLPFSFNGTPLKDAQGKIIGAIGVGRDLREIKKLIDQLREAKVGLEEKVKERTNELEEKVKELERFTKIAMGRELRIAELKEEIAKLKKENKKKKKTQDEN